MPIPIPGRLAVRLPVGLIQTSQPLAAAFVCLGLEFSIQHAGHHVTF
jgi:hypothetical protein